MTGRSLSTRAWTLPEAIVLLVVVAVLVGFLCLAGADNRRRSRVAGGLDNLHFFGSGTESYAADHHDQFWAFTWRRYIVYAPGFPAAPDDISAVANQAVEIMRRRGPTPQASMIPGWVPLVSYSHLVLLDHLGTTLNIPQVASPEDGMLRSWQRTNSENEWFTLPHRPTGNFAGFRWRFYSSYEIGTAFSYRDAATFINGALAPTISQGNTVGQFFVPSAAAPAGPPPRRRDEVRFPSDKAHVWDRYQRHFGPQVLHFGYAEARLPILMVDGSASIRSNTSANQGFSPANPNSPNATVAAYQPDTWWEPPTRNGTSSETVTLRLRYTRWGLRGRDFNGPEVSGP